MAAAAIAAALAGTLLWLSLLAAPVRLSTGLLGASLHLDRAQNAISKGAFKRARFETLAASAAAERAFGALHGPVLDVAGALPSVGRVLGEAPHLVAAARHSAAAARGSLEVAGGALRGPNKIVAPGDGASRLRLDRIEALGALVRRVRAHVRAAGDDLASVELANLPARARPAVKAGIRRANRTADVLSEAVAGFKLLPDILGARERRLYLLAMQNSAELRGTGGSLLRFSLLQFEEGEPRLLPSRSVYKIDREREQLSVPLPPSAWHVRTIEDAQRFGNANWSPDWPLSARLTLRYGYHSRVPLPRVDGVVGVDPLLMRELMPGVGVFRTAGGRQVSRTKVVPFLLHRAYAIYPNPGVRRSALQRIVEAFYANLLEPERPTELIQGLGAALARKHMQIYMARPKEMSFVERMNWDGGIERSASGDYLYVVEQNVGGNKLDFTSQHHHTMDVRLADDDATVSTEVRVHNNVFLPQPNYWLGNSGPCHRPMINVYVPGNAELIRPRAPAPGGPPKCSTVVRRLDSPVPAAWSNGRPPEHRELGKKVWPATLEIPPGRSGAVRFDYIVPNAIQRRGGRNVYRLLIQRQPKVHPDAVVVRVHLPRGARDIVAPGWTKRATTLEWQHPLIRDTTLEVSWR